MEINNEVGNMGLSENHGKVYEIHEGTDLEKRCDKNMTGLQSFNG